MMLHAPLQGSMESVYGPLRNYFEIFDKFFKTYGKPICNVNHEVWNSTILHAQKRNIVWLPESA